MLRTDVERALFDDFGDGRQVLPDYAGYSFANVNPTLLSALGADTERSLPETVFEGVATDGDGIADAVDRVVCLFLDGYGWDGWKRDRDDVALLSALTDRGTVTPLTSVYPSETTAATTTFHTGRTPVEHGLLGWWQYVPAVDGVVQPLPFETLDGQPAEERYPDLSKEDLHDGTSIYDRAAADGVESHLFQPFPATGAEADAVEASTYRNVADLARRLREALEDRDGADYLYGYVPNVDTAAHAAGTESADYRAQLEMVCACLRRELVDRIDAGVAAETLFVVVADHGIVDTVPEENPDIGPDDFPELWDALRRDGDGEPIPPVGSPRNVHLHLQDGTVGEVRDRVESRFPCRTYTREEAVEVGLFGTEEPSETFRECCGDLIVVHRDRGPWWDASERELVGMHGGLAREEMLVPFAAATLADL